MLLLGDGLQWRRRQYAAGVGGCKFDVVDHAAAAQSRNLCGSTSREFAFKTLSHCRGQWPCVADTTSAVHCLQVRRDTSAVPLRLVTKFVARRPPWIISLRSCIDCNGSNDRERMRCTVGHLPANHLRYEGIGSTWCTSMTCTMLCVINIAHVTMRSSLPLHLSATYSRKLISQVQRNKKCAPQLIVLATLSPRTEKLAPSMLRGETRGDREYGTLSQGRSQRGGHG